MGSRRKTRRKLEQKVAHRPSITRFLQEFKIGQNVVISPEPSSHRGVPFSRFKGRVGEIVDKRGKSYVVKLKVGKKTKKVISRPEHLKPLNI